MVPDRNIQLFTDKFFVLRQYFCLSLIGLRKVIQRCFSLLDGGALA